MAKIVERKQKDIPVCDLQDGHLGVIVAWDGSDEYIGKIVQRYDKSLVCIGAESGDGWSTCPTNTMCRVEVLHVGTVIEI